MMNKRLLAFHSSLIIHHSLLPPVHLEDGDGLFAVLDRDGWARAEFAARFGGRARRGVAQDYLAGRGVLLQTRREVDRVADGRVLGAPLRADVAHGGDAGVEPDADGYLGESVGAELRVDALHLALHLDGG